MAAENKSVANLLNLCHRLMEELGMPKMVLNELIGRVCRTSELESFHSVKYWKTVTAYFYFLEEKIAIGPFRPDKNQGIIMKPQIPDLNQPAPGNEEEPAVGPFKSDKNQSTIMKPQIPDLNQPAPGNEEEPAVGLFKPDKNQSTIMEPQIPDLNQPAPGNDEEEPWELHLKPSVIIQDHAKVVELEAKATTTSKRKILQFQHEREIAQANHYVTKRFKITEESVGPSSNVRGMDIFKMEGWGEN